MEADGKATDGQIDQTVTMMKDHFTLFAIVGIQFLVLQFSGL